MNETYVINEDIKETIANLEEGCSVRFKYDQTGTIAKITNVLQGTIPSDARYFITLEYCGTDIGTTHTLPFASLEEALTRIGDDDKSYFVTDKGTYRERVEREAKFQKIVKICGQCENERGIPDEKRYTICLGEQDFIAKQYVSREYIEARYHDWSWERYAKLNMHKNNKDFVLLFGQNNADKIAKLALDNDVYFYTNTFWEEGLYSPYWSVDIVAKLDNDEVSFSLDRNALCSSAWGNKGIEWVIKELKEIANSPAAHCSYKNLDTEALKSGADKVSAFAKRLEEYSKSINKSRSSIERD